MASDPQLDDADELDLRSYVAVLRRRWRTIAAVAAGCVLIVLAVSVQQDEQYRAEADVLIRQRSVESLFTGDQPRSAQDAERQLNNEVRLLESGGIVAAVEAVYDGPLDPDDVEASVSSDSSDVVTVSLTATDAGEAAELVNLYVTTFVETRRQQRVDELLAAGAEIQTQIDQLQAEIAQAQEPLVAAEAALAADPDDDVLVAQRDAAAAQVAGALAGLQSRQSFYAQQLEDLEVTANIARSGAAQVITKADVPDDPVSPKPLRDGAIALVLGLVLGVGLAFLRDNLDERIRGIDDLERATGGLPALALVPEAETRPDPNFVAARDDPRSVIAEAYRSLRTSVKFAALDRPIKVVQVTSPAAGEGKTSTAANLAVALAQGGDRVAVVCCDLRRPTMHERFAMAPTPGFTDVLVGDVALSAALRRYQSSSIMVLAAGTHAPNPSELLSTTRAAGIVGALAEEFDFVILDTTPVLPVTDSLVVSRLADATVLVVDARSTRRNGIRRALQLLRQVNAPVLGVVLNGVPSGDDYGYGYGYDYGPAEGADADGSRRARRGAEQPAASSR